MELAGKKVLVVGLGDSGLAAARLCLQQGALVTATDQSPSPPGAEELARQGARLSLGGHRREDFLQAELVVLSPGVDPRRPEVQAAEAAGAEVLGELELGFRFLQAPAVMITGTNGKSTVTTLVGRMLAASGLRTFVGGNLGTPLCSFILRGEEVDWAVLEVSSFQIDTARELRPRVGVILNLAPDHLDRYPDFAAYAASKFRLLANQAGDDLAVLYDDDPEVRRRKGQAPARVWTYGASGPRRPGGWLEGDHLVMQSPSGHELRLDTSASPLPGLFNRLNLLAACLAALGAGADVWALQGTINLFRGLPHRLQLVASLEGVDWLDDSKGTNVGAVRAALAALERPVVLLLGGRDKGDRFPDLAPELQSRVRLVICFGEAGPAIARQLQGLAPIQVEPDLPAAVAAARAAARPGEAVLLSPGCASFDAYQDYSQRGRHFQALVRGEPWNA